MRCNAPLGQRISTTSTCLLAQTEVEARIMTRQITAAATRLVELHPVSDAHADPSADVVHPIRDGESSASVRLRHCAIARRAR